MPKGRPKSRVVHFRKAFHDVYIGRPSKWGNPFVMGPDGSREEVIKKYEEYIRSNPEAMADLGELKNQILGCWCAPKPCHGDVLIKLLKENGIE